MLRLDSSLVVAKDAIYGTLWVIVQRDAFEVSVLAFLEIVKLLHEQFSTTRACSVLLSRHEQLTFGLACELSFKQLLLIEPFQG